MVRKLNKPSKVQVKFSKSNSNSFSQFYYWQKNDFFFLKIQKFRVAASPECKMPIQSLAKIFGPTIIGYSVPDPAELNVLRETKDQCKVCVRFLFLSF